jgi:hypothetical protein
VELRSNQTTAKAKAIPARKRWFSFRATTNAAPNARNPTAFTTADRLGRQRVRLDSAVNSFRLARFKDLRRSQ